jgi:hypothetical protein
MQAVTRVTVVFYNMIFVTHATRGNANRRRKIRFENGIDGKGSRIVVDHEQSSVMRVTNVNLPVRSHAHAMPLPQKVRCEPTTASLG